MAGEGQEVGAHFLYVHRGVGHQLRGVDDGQGPGFPGGSGDLRHRGHGAEHIGHTRHRHHLDPLVEQLPEGRHVELVVVAERHVDQLGAGLAAHQLPWHHIGVVFHDREQDAVPFLQPVQAPAEGHRVEAGSGAAGEHHFGR